MQSIADAERALPMAAEQRPNRPSMFLSAAFRTVHSDAGCDAIAGREVLVAFQTT
jgi:hypothetical protein